MSLLDNLPHRCDFYRRDRHNDDIGGPRDVPVLTTSNVACWEQQAGAGDCRLYQKRGIKITHKVFFNADPGLTEQYQIKVTDHGQGTISNPPTLEVRSRVAPDDSAGLGCLFSVMCEEVTSRK